MAEPLSYVFPPYRLIPSRRCVLRDNAPVVLGGRAFDVLLALVERRERGVSKQELLDVAWPGLVVQENNLQVQVSTLRKLLGYAAVATIPGRGYRFTLSVEVEGGTEQAGTTAHAAAGMASQRRTNLPRSLPNLIGRDDALASLTALIRSCSWVTVAGPAGIGKTRLAQSAAHALFPEMPGGVWWVDLAPLSDPGLIPAAVLAATGVVSKESDSMAVLCPVLAEPGTILVLDNAEHLLDGVASFLAELRSKLDQLRLVVTSQEIIHAPEEHVFRLGPLDLPIDESLTSTQRSDAVSLFLARARAADRYFELGEGNCSAVAEICRRLDGIPLAIELAAARVPLLGLEGLRARMDQRFRVLTAGDRTTQLRHRTLREALDWSYQLLSDDERAVFRRLGVFAGGFTLEAAQAVASADGRLDPWDVLEHVGALVDKSLVVAVGDPVPRYHLLETMRLFALERLIEQHEVDDARTAHREHYLAVAEIGGLDLAELTPEKLSTLDLERDNLLLAMGWVRQDPDGSKGLRLARAMRLYWTSRGLVERGLEVTRLALSHPGAATATVPRVAVELSAAVLCFLTGRNDEAIAHAQRSLAGARELGDGYWTTLSLARLGVICARVGRWNEAAQYADEAVLLSPPEDASPARAWVLEASAEVFARTGRHDRALVAETEIVRLRQVIGDRRGELAARLNLSWTAIVLGQLDLATDHLAQAAALARQTGSALHEVILLRVAAAHQAASGRAAEAITLHSAYRNHASRMGLHLPEESEEVELLLRARAQMEPELAAQAEARGRDRSQADAFNEVVSLLSH